MSFYLGEGKVDLPEVKEMISNNKPADNLKQAKLYTQKGTQGTRGHKDRSFSCFKWDVNANLEFDSNLNLKAKFNPENCEYQLKCSNNSLYTEFVHTRKQRHTELAAPVLMSYTVSALDYLMFCSGFAALSPLTSYVPHCLYCNQALIFCCPLALILPAILSVEHTPGILKNTEAHGVHTRIKRTHTHNFAEVVGCSPVICNV